MQQRRLCDRFAACSSAALLAAGLLIGSAGPASAATTVTISAPTVVLSNGQATISGAVSSDLAGATLNILKYTSGTWKSVAQPTLSAARKYTVKVTIPPGGNAFMARATKSSTRKFSTSVKVYGVTDRGMILYKTNAYRKAYGLPALKGLSSLDKVAQDWTQYMYDNSDFRHNPNYWTQYPGTPKAGAENVASGTGNGLTSSNVVGKWMTSAGHKANILGSYTHIGIGYVSVSGTAYATQNFARY